MMEVGTLRKKQGEFGDDFTKLIFSWSIDDILNEDLYKHKVEKIPLTFKSEQHYFGSFVYPLLEETRAELASSMEIVYRAPFAEVLSSNKATRDGKKRLYDITIGPWRKQFSEHGKEPFQTLPGDLLIIVNGKPESISDLQRMGRTWAFSFVNKITEDDTEDDTSSTSIRFEVTASRNTEFQEGMFVIFLMNVTTQKRIWNSLQMSGNMNIIKEVLYSDSMVKEKCNICSFDCDCLFSQNPYLLEMLNGSQRAAITASLHKTDCCHNSYVEQIWGPPGTGKTTTVSVLLYILLRMSRRTLACAPTSIAILQLASRVLSLVKESSKTTIASGNSFCSLGDVLLFGNKERLKIGAGIEDIYLDHRVIMLTECLGPLTGWKYCMRSMFDLLENCVTQYHVFLENELLKEKQLENESQNETKTNMLEVNSFISFLQDRFRFSILPLRRCIFTFLTHIPRSFMKEYSFHSLIYLLDILSSFESLLFEKNLVSEELEHLFTSKIFPNELGDLSSIYSARAESLLVLRALQISLEGIGLPNVLNKYELIDFCFERATLIFCTTSSSYKLHTIKMKPLNILVIDEAAQLKEAESIIPLQLPGMKHAIIIGDECQIPAMVSAESGFGRSLFDRLSSLGHSKHLLNVQYRMHPSISFFPNWRFYQNQILNAENVLCKSYEKQYLTGPMFGSYSFINVSGGREEKGDDGRGRRNMVEVAIVIKIVKNLYRAWIDSKRKLTIGVVSPYAAQVASIQEKLAPKYKEVDGFTVKVKSIDGFQGGEEDIIILSTVRSNGNGSIGFLSSPQRTNVALTRARHCLWILGNRGTLADSDTVWKDLVCDARNRRCLFDADADECLKMTIIAAKKELEQLDDLVNGNSVLFKNAKWKVLFSDIFRKSFGKLKCPRLKKLVLNLLLKLSGGWRPKNRSVELCCGNSSHILKQFKVEGLYVICTIDVIKELNYIQVLKVWDVLPFEEIPKLAQRLDNIFASYTDDYITRCTTKLLEGNLEIPKSWPASQEVVRFRDLSNNEVESESSENLGDGSHYVENSKVSESLLLMKFYSLSSDVVNHLLSGKEVELPMQVTDEQMDIILFTKSSFIIGRSGTGKTTILTMKLFQNEQTFRAASEGIYEAESSGISDSEAVDDLQVSKPRVLRQIFVTVSPKLCYAVKQHVSHLTICNGDSSAEINFDDADLTSEFKDIPDTLIGIPVKCYPLVITFHKFIMMLDGTLGDSFLERFLVGKEGSIALKNIIRLKEVTYDRFCAFYWPRFNSKFKKGLEPSRVFTEIISYIKGGIRAGEGMLSFENYCLLSESRTSTLTKRKRETVYTLFEAYEKMKSERGEFDLGDFVNDIHHRLRNGNYAGDQIDFVYIDEVQDLSMRQISLFKYICQNVEEGFIFSGDTAQTIARGIDFRFQDIRSLFYTEFLSGKHEKGIVSEIFQLKQNFRTHAGVLDLAQSVIDIIYCYFVHSIDKLEPEISLISGEAPVLLESGNDENAIVTIFGGSGSGGEIVGFGAEQVILVRDNFTKTEICEYVGKNALVLTIVECKGLEFQDVLLYNFFGTSPLKDQWRVIYGYMKECDWLDETLPLFFPTFSDERHSVLCSELKQLYVAITRTRQRLWICENKEELSKPMFDYWKKRGLVQIRKLDDSMVQAMQVASSPQEWRERGKKLYFENNFVMATMCFERAGDTMWEKLAKASGLRASADQMRGKNHEAFLGYLREAAGIFESIGKLESAALCYSDLGEYKTAGKSYRCGKTDEADGETSESFSVAEHDSDAAKAYAKGEHLSNCLSACKEGKLFEKGFQYIQYWKEHANDQSTEIEQNVKEFLEICALDYHKRNDLKSMMKFVQAFCSMESKRVFLRSLNCLYDLLLLEEESGNFLDAAELARSWGDVLKEAYLLEKAGNAKEATNLLLWYVFFSSLWGNGNRGWPLKHFAKKEEHCKKAALLAEMDSDVFYDFVSVELKVLSDQPRSLLELKEDLHASQKSKSLRGEILSIRKILDAHFHINPSEYDWEDELPIGIYKHCEEMISQNRVSIKTLTLYWTLLRKHVMDIFKCLESFHDEEPKKHEGYIEFSLNYFGVRKQCVNGNTVYLLVNKDADWIKNAGQKGLHMDMDGKRVMFDGKQLVCVIRAYWQSGFLSVSIKVLEILESLHKLKSNGSAFHQSTSLVHIFEVSKFLIDCQSLNLTSFYKKKLQSLLATSTNYFDFVFPLDWRKSMSENLIFLRNICLSICCLLQFIVQNVDVNCDITYWTIGRVMMICLCDRKSLQLHHRISKGLQWNPAWKSFVDAFCLGGLKDADVVPGFQMALEDTFRANWRRPGYISPHSFVYLLDSFLFFASFSSGEFFTTKSSLIGWLTQFYPTDTPSTNLPESKQTIPHHAVYFIVGIVKKILYNTKDTVSWIQRSKISPTYYHPLLALKLVMMMSLICLQVSDCSQVLLDLLSGENNIAYFLPENFVHNLLKSKNSNQLRLNPEVVAEAFTGIDDPLVIASSKASSQITDAPSAIFVDLGKTKEEIMNVLFSKKNTSSEQKSSTSDDVMRLCEPSSSSSSSSTSSSSNTSADSDVNPIDGCKGELNMNCNVLEEILDVGTICELPSSSNTLRDANLNVNPLDGSKNGKKFTMLRDALTDMKMVSSSFETSRQKEEDLVIMKSIQRAVESLPGFNMKKFSVETKVGNLGASDCRSSSIPTQIEETGDDNLLADTVLEKQSNQTCSNKVDVGTICEPPSLNTSLDAELNVNGCKGELNMNWEVIETISDVFSFPLLESSFTKAKNDVHSNICTLATALGDGKSCSRKVTKLVRQAVGELNKLASAFDSRKCGPSIRGIQGVVERLQSMRPMIDDFLKHYVINWKSNVGKMTVLDGSSTCKIEETGDGNTQNAKNKKENGNSNSKKSKKSKGKKK